MHFNFQPDIPEDYDSDQIRLISGELSLQFLNTAFLVCRDKMGIHNVFRINFEYRCSPFMEAIIAGNLIAVGHEANFYLYNMEKNTTLAVLKADGYFGHLYLHDEHFYIADATGITCMDDTGKIVWMNNNLGIDGILINKFENEMISGVGEWDPPGGWQHISLNKYSGKLSL